MIRLSSALLLRCSYSPVEYPQLAPRLAARPTPQTAFPPRLPIGIGLAYRPLTSALWVDRYADPGGRRTDEGRTDGADAGERAPRGRATPRRATP